MLVPLLLQMAAYTTAKCSWKDGAKDIAAVSFHSRSVKGGVEKLDPKKAVVEWKPKDMLDDVECFNADKTELHFKVLVTIA